MAILTFREPNKNRWIYFTSFIYIYLYIYIYVYPHVQIFSTGRVRTKKVKGKRKKQLEKGLIRCFFFSKMIEWLNKNKVPLSWMKI